MEMSALAQEKVWFDKPSYDKAERRFFEKLAKVVANNKITEKTANKSKTPELNSKKKVMFSENIPNDTPKGNNKTKVTKSNKDENIYNVLKDGNIEEEYNINNVLNDMKKKESSPSNNATTKTKIESVKQKKNKAEVENRNRGQAQYYNAGYESFSGYQSYVPPHIRLQKQICNQGNQQTTSPMFSAGGSLASEIAKAHRYIKESLQCVNNIAVVSGLINPPENVKDNLDGAFEQLRICLNNLEKRVKVLEDTVSQMPHNKMSDPISKKRKAQEKTEDEDEDVDAYGSDSEGEDAEADLLGEKSTAACEPKGLRKTRKGKKPAVIAKSNIVLDVKPCGDQTDLAVMESEVRKIELDGLSWGVAKLVPLAYGIVKLQISCVVEDEKLSLDTLLDEILTLDDYVQSVDVADFKRV